MLAFIHVAKTGGQSIATMLRSSYGLNHCDAVFLSKQEPRDPFDVKFVVPKFAPGDFRQMQKYWPRMKSISGHPIALWSELDSVEPQTQYFALVREPMKRGASHFQYHIRHDRPCLDWDRWVDWPVHQNHQVKMFSRSVDVDDAIRQIEAKEVFVGLTERFDETLVLLKAILAPDLNIAYIRTNTARDNSVAHDILADPRKQDQIRNMYRADIELHEYVTQEIYPRYQKEYGPRLAQDVQKFQERQRQAVNRRNLWLNKAYTKLVFQTLKRLHR